MSLLLFASFQSAFLGWAMGILSLMLILLILVQRGKGGGLTGALGGPGGQSAFGSKAGDTFTLITVVFATVWALVCAVAMWSLGTQAPEIAEVPPVIESQGDDTGTAVIPNMGGDAGDLSGLSGLSGLPLDSTETPSMDLTPATPEGTPATETPEPAEEPAAPETPASETPASETPAAETTSTETPAAEPASTETASTEPASTEPASTETPAEPEPAPAE